MDHRPHSESVKQEQVSNLYKKSKFVRPDPKCSFKMNY